MPAGEAGLRSLGRASTLKAQSGGRNCHGVGDYFGRMFATGTLASGAKAQSSFWRFSGTDKSVPFQNHRAEILGRLNLCPFKIEAISDWGVLREGEAEDGSLAYARAHADRARVAFDELLAYP